MRILRASNGQGVLEMILMMCVMLFIAVAVTRGLREMQIVGKLVEGPWSIMSGMITNGVWGSADKTKIHHPNYIRRHITFEAEKLQ